MSGYAASETERQLAGLIRIGVISALDDAGARVRVQCGGLTTDWLPWLTMRAGADRSWWAPEPGEQVVVLSPNGDTAQGVVLPALYSDALPPPANARTVHRTTYADGSVVEYDRAAHQLTVNVGSGQVVVVCNTATVQAAESVTLDTPQTVCTGNLAVTGVMNVMGTGAGGAATSTFQGTIRVEDGDVIADDISLKGHGHIEQGDGARTGNSVP